MRYFLKRERVHLSRPSGCSECILLPEMLPSKSRLWHFIRSFLIVRCHSSNGGERAWLSLIVDDISPVKSRDMFTLGKENLLDHCARIISGEPFRYLEHYRNFGNRGFAVTREWFWLEMYVKNLRIILFFLIFA